MSVGIQGGQNRLERPAAGQVSGPADWDSLKEGVGEIAGTAVERGRHFLDSARLQAVSYADERKNGVAQSVTDFAQSLREATKAFDDRPNIRALVDSAAEGLDQVADSIRNRSYADMYEAVEDAMRRRPAAFGGAALAAGFLLSRFIKASAANAAEARGRRPQPARAGSTPRRTGARPATRG